MVAWGICFPLCLIRRMELFSLPSTLSQARRQGAVAATLASAAWQAAGTGPRAVTRPPPAPHATQFGIFYTVAVVVYHAAATDLGRDRPIAPGGALVGPPGPGRGPIPHPLSPHLPHQSPHPPRRHQVVRPCNSLTEERWSLGPNGSIALQAAGPAAAAAAQLCAALAAPPVPRPPPPAPACCGPAGARRMRGPRPWSDWCAHRSLPQAEPTPGCAAPTGVFPPAFAPAPAALAGGAPVLYTSGAGVPRRLVLAACGAASSDQSFAFDPVINPLPSPLPSSPLRLSPPLPSDSPLPSAPPGRAAMHSAARAHVTWAAVRRETAGTLEELRTAVRSLRSPVARRRPYCYSTTSPMRPPCCDQHQGGSCGRGAHRSQVQRVDL